MSETKNRLSIRVDEKTFEHIGKAASKAEKSKTEFVLDCIFARIGQPAPGDKTDSDAVMKRRPYRPYKLQTTKALNRLGALNVIAYRISKRINAIEVLNFEQGLEILLEIRTLNTALEAIRRKVTK